MTSQPPQDGQTVCIHAKSPLFCTECRAKGQSDLNNPKIMWDGLTDCQNNVQKALDTMLDMCYIYETRTDDVVFGDFHDDIMSVQRLLRNSLQIRMIQAHGI